MQAQGVPVPELESSVPDESLLSESELDSESESESESVSESESELESESESEESESDSSAAAACCAATIFGNSCIASRVVGCSFRRDLVSAVEKPQPGI